MTAAYSLIDYLYSIVLWVLLIKGVIYLCKKIFA